MSLLVRSKQQTDRLSRTGTGFLGNYLDKITVQYTLEIIQKLVITAFTPIYYDSTEDSLTLSVGSWEDLTSAFNGANIDIDFGSGVTSTTVTSVNGAVMIVAASLGSSGSKTTGYIEVTDQPKDLELKYNLVRNSVGSGTGSLIDGNDVRFSTTDIDLLSVSGSQSLTQIGNKSGGSIFDTSLLTRIADSSKGHRRFTIDLTYKIWACLDSDDYFSGEALGDYAEIDVFMLSGDPSSKVSETHFQLGGTGYENENFNGGNPNYVLTSIEWEDVNTNPMQAFDYTQDSYFDITITKQSGNFDASDSFDFKMFTIPNDSNEYSNKSLPLDNNLMLAQNITPIAPSTPTSISGNLNESSAGYNVIRP